MRIKSVKCSSAAVTVEYQVERTDGQYDEYTLTSNDAPVRSFYDALAALSTDVVQMCEFAGGDVDVRGVSFSHKKGILGVVVTALKSIERSASPLIINTPHTTEKPYAENAETPVLSTAMIGRLRAVILEAERYVNGTRAQRGLLKKEKDTNDD